MDSRISIKPDFSHRNTPYIEVIYNNSDDPRDEMVKVFQEKLMHTSQWARIEWQVNGNTFRIYPISVAELPDDVKRIEESIQVAKTHPTPDCRP